MKRIFLKNMIIVLILIILVIPYNYFFKYFAAQLNTFAYAMVIIYALICGVALVLMDLTNKKVNMFFAVFYLIYSVIEIQYSFFVYGPTVYLLILIVGTLFASTLREIKKYD